MIHCEDIMTREVVAVSPTSTLDEAVELMLDNRVSGLPVVDDSQRLVGIISEFALLVLTYDKKAGKDTVAEHMTRAVISVDISVLLSDVADIFILNRFRRVPVTCDGKLVGIISRRDLMRAANGSRRSFARPELLARKRTIQETGV